MRTRIDEAIRIVKEQRPSSLDHALALLQDTVFAYSMKICGHREDAEDTAQEVLVRTAKFITNFDNPMALSVWLYKVARNECLMKRRRTKHEGPLEEFRDEITAPDAAQVSMPNPEALVLRLEAAERVLDEIRALPEQYRIVLTLHDLEELGTREVARILGASEGAVRVRLHRARRLLRDQLEEHSLQLA